MSTRAALVAAVAASPDDDTARLVLADFLDETGDPDRAAFVRLSVVGHPDADALLADHAAEWVAPLAAAAGGPRPASAWVPAVRANPPGRHAVVVGRPGDPFRHLLDVRFRGGLVEHVTLAADPRLPPGALAALLALEPITSLSLVEPCRRPPPTLLRAAGWGDLRCPEVRRLRSLAVTATLQENTGLARTAAAACADPDLGALTAFAFERSDPLHGVRETPALVVDALAASAFVGNLRRLKVNPDHDAFPALFAAPLLRSVESLDLSHSFVWDTEADLLNAIPNRRGVTELVLDWALADERAADRLFAGGWDALESLSLAHCELSAAAVRRLRSSSFAPNLRRLGIPDATLGTDGVRLLADALTPGVLELLDLTRVPLDADDLRVLRQRFGPGVVFAAGDA